MFISIARTKGKIEIYEFLLLHVLIDPDQGETGIVMHDGGCVQSLAEHIIEMSNL